MTKTQMTKRISTPRNLLNYSVLGGDKKSKSKCTTPAKRVRKQTKFFMSPVGVSSTRKANIYKKVKKINKKKKVPTPIMNVRKYLTENEKLIVMMRQRMFCNMSNCNRPLTVHVQSKRKLFDFDHIIPVAKGGLTTIENMQALCKDCHTIKTGYDNKY